MGRRQRDGAGCPHAACPEPHTGVGGKGRCSTTVFVLTPTDSLLIFHADPQRACETPARRGSKHGEYRPSDLAIHKTSDLARVGHDMTTSEYRALCPAPGRPIPPPSRSASTRSHPLIRAAREADGLMPIFQRVPC